MPRKLIFKDGTLQTNTPNGFKALGYNSGVLSESDTEVRPIDTTGGGNGGETFSNCLSQTNPLRYLLCRCSSSLDYPPAQRLDIILDDGGFIIPKTLGFTIDDDVYVLASADTFSKFIGEDFEISYSTSLGYTYPTVGLLDILKGSTQSYFGFTNSTSLSYYIGNSSIMEYFNTAMSAANYNFYGSTFSLESKFNDFINNNSDNWKANGILTTTQSIINRFSDKGIIELGKLNGENQFDTMMDFVSKWSDEFVLNLSSYPYGPQVVERYDESIGQTVSIPNFGSSIEEIYDRILDKGIVILKVKYAYNGYDTGDLLVTNVERFLQIVFSKGTNPNPA